jgi:hypothetical protein
MMTISRRTEESVCIMIPRLVITLLVGVSALAAAAPWNSTPKPIKGTYQVYGGGLGDMVPPTKKDRKVSFSFTGPFAKELFDQIGPDLKDACGASPTHSERNGATWIVSATEKNTCATSD